MSPIQRKPYQGNGIEPIAELAAGVTTIPQALAFRQARKAQLENDVQQEQDSAVMFILQKRIEKLTTQNGGAVLGTLISCVRYSHTLKDQLTVQDTGNQIGVNIDQSVPWSIEYAMGGWDADTLTGRIFGKLQIPVV